MAMDHIEKIRELARNGVSQRRIASELGITRQMVRYALKNDLVRQSPVVAAQLLAQGAKRCPGCKNILPINDFYSSKSQRDGLASHCKICQRLLQRLRPKEERIGQYQQNKEKIRDKHLKKAFGISLQEYKKMEKAQGGVCAICNGLNSDRALAVDHNHINGQVRALLCTPCNIALGLLKEDINIIQNLISYIERFKNGVHFNPKSL